eukprot:TRINITY_DN49870_c0_g1_i1.p1 TRINITY_DN49870_c0_g1~~TRINITY_DN49870_c0_g1_i1.p1  ORF type:complete len:105 (-),score=19.32 TRINITY_DN49870_c0_g1_i1:252-566(-)
MPAGELEVFRFTGEVVRFPEDEETGELSAMIHDSLQDADWQLLSPGAPVFQCFNGEVILWEGEEVYPVFVNEVAYIAPPPLGNSRRVAFLPCRREVLVVPALNC